MKLFHTTPKKFLSGLACPLLLLALVACSDDSIKSADALDFDEKTSCELDGMLLAEYPGPKAQIVFQGQTKPVYYCDTLELLHTLLLPEQKRLVSAAYVQDMAKTSWDKPQGHWLKAEAAWYVQGSRKHGSMGPTFASFSQQSDAERFAKEHGGKVYAFNQIKAEMVDLSGGALHDGKM